MPVESGRLGLASNFDLCEAFLPGSFYRGSCQDTLESFFSKGNELESDQVLHFGIVLVDRDVVNKYVKKGRKETIKSFYGENCVPKFQDIVSPASEMIAALLIMNVEMTQNSYSGTNFILSNAEDKQFCKGN